MKSKITLSSLLVLCGCAASTGVVSMGSDKYSVMRRDNGPMSSLGALKAEAYKEMNTFCLEKGLKAEVLHSNDVPRSLGQFPETEVQFRCVSKP